MWDSQPSGGVGIKRWLGPLFRNGEVKLMGLHVLKGFLLQKRKITTVETKLDQLSQR
jgi:hypothetical protein